MNIEEKNKMIGVLYEIEDERTRQNQKWGVQNHSPITMTKFEAELIAREKVAACALELRFFSCIKDDLTEEGLKHYEELLAFVLANIHLLD